ncbi:MAG: type I-E CRISPR-associated protein Cse1/CasA [Spirochaetae bacterium HGW-Spirochaetae-3]|jgi:CRISPR system Cascade subunit CasA|nr:MAG: type I-E CRISPR-associated protein Cse1/CasA [Spirochaetae bacterium HGW-Spirochaetae-3]
MERATNRFNLIDEPWIPVAGIGPVSLMRIFSDPNLRALGGNPIQKIALIKLLLAIAQAAVTPRDEAEWEALGTEGLAAKTRAYLNEKRDCFWLYGEKPFLQIRGIASARLTSYGSVIPSVSTGNTTVLTMSQIERIPDDAERALILVQLMGFGLGGKKTDNSIVLSTGYTGKTNDKGKPSTGKPGTSIGFLGFLHSFIIGSTLWDTIRVNLITQQQLNEHQTFQSALGPVPWETPPTGEACPIAKSLQTSLLGRLVPFSRFVLLEEDGIRYSEGVAYPGYKEGGTDPSMAVSYSQKEPKVLWVDPEKRPWRMLTSLLSFIQSDSANPYDCLSLRLALPRAIKMGTEITVWSGGLRVSSNAGEQYVSGTDDYVESEISLPVSLIGRAWFEQLKLETGALEDLSKAVYGSCLSYYRDIKSDGDMFARQASNLFWQLAERQFQDLIDACTDANKAKTMRRIFANYAQQAYDTFCPKDTARQLDAWAANKPYLGKYLA